MARVKKLPEVAYYPLSLGIELPFPSAFLCIFKYPIDRRKVFIACSSHWTVFVPVFCAVKTPTGIAILMVWRRLRRPGKQTRKTDSRLPLSMLWLKGNPAQTTGVSRGSIESNDGSNVSLTVQSIRRLLVLHPLPRACHNAQCQPHLQHSGLPTASTLFLIETGVRARVTTNFCRSSKVQSRLSGIFIRNKR